MFTFPCRIQSLAVTALVMGFTLAAGVPSYAMAADLSAESAGRSLVIGKISPDPKKHYRYLKPMAEYVVSKMGDLGYTRAKVLMAKNNRQMARYLRRGKVDWVTETPFSAMTLKHKTGAELLVRKWKKQVPEYHTVFFTRNDSGIEKLEDLKGRTIVFEDPGSTSAFYIPASILIDQGLELIELESYREQAPEDAVGFVFSGAEINMTTWVHKGIGDAGAYSNLDWDKEDHTPSAFRKDFIQFHRSTDFPRSIELVRKGLPDTVKQRIKEILLQAHEDPAAANALRAYQKTRKFDELDEDSMAALRRTEAIMQLVDETLDR